MTHIQPADSFTPEHAQAYDARNSKLSAISNTMHFLIRLVLQDLPANARILCVGAGTGAEILSLAQAYPAWSFLGVDPSAAMLEVCDRNLQAAGISDRCQLVHGYVEDAPTGEAFDAALSILVAHFIPKEQRLGFFRQMVSRLKPQGRLVNAEISADMDATTFSAELNDWQKIQTLMGATPESLANLPHLLRHVLNVLPPAHTDEILRQSGIALPVSFFQSSLIRGWHGRKAD